MYGSRAEIFSPWEPAGDGEVRVHGANGSAERERVRSESEHVRVLRERVRPRRDLGEAQRRSATFRRVLLKLYSESKSVAPASQSWFSTPATPHSTSKLPNPQDVRGKPEARMQSHNVVRDSLLSVLKYVLRS